MAQKDLIPMNKRTEAQQKEIAQKGGIASGEARRKKKTMKEQAELLLSLVNKNPKLEKIMNELGIENDERTNQMAMIISMMNRAIESGDVSAFNSLQATIGEKPVDKVQATVSNYESTLKAVDGDEY